MRSTLWMRDTSNELPCQEIPLEDPWPSIAIVLDAERRIRGGQQIEASALGLSDYWCDLVRILQIFFAKGDQTENFGYSRTDILQTFSTVHPWSPSSGR